MEELNWKRTEYDTWDDAFAGLMPVLRQQSLRVAHYTRALFVQACVDKFDTESVSNRLQMREENADVAFKCGLYHQLGKSLVPHAYQLIQKDFTQEEIAVYRKYTTDGSNLVKLLQERAGQGKTLESNVPAAMVQLACTQHMERWDGSGYPAGLVGREISAIGQIVGLAKELDRLSAETKSETPFDEAVDHLTREGNGDFAPELIQVLKESKTQCEEIYRKYIYYTMTLPKTIPLVVKGKNPAMRVHYQPMIAHWNEPPVAYEAVSWFGGRREGESPEPLHAVEGMLERTGLMAEMMTYLLYVVGDGVYRFGNYKLDLTAIIFPLPGAFLKNPEVSNIIKQFFADQGIAKKQIIFAIAEPLLLSDDLEIASQIRILGKKGYHLLADNCHPENLSVDQLKEFGIKYVRLDSDLNRKEIATKWLETLKLAKFTLIGGKADSLEAVNWMEGRGISYMSGMMAGLQQTEEDLFREALLRERDL